MYIITNKRYIECLGVVYIHFDYMRYQIVIQVLYVYL